MVPVLAETYRDFTYWVCSERLDPAGYRYARPEDLRGYRGEVVILRRAGHGLVAGRDTYPPV
jgi:hypothetical protein